LADVYGVYFSFADWLNLSAEPILAALNKFQKHRGGGYLLQIDDLSRERQHLVGLREWRRKRIALHCGPAHARI
jgi:hypothetical protein